jgi:hypothetical protein|tara:strand:+ start:281 stop:550 length:270 start_codon:yes stop_codon:yes gene_type:complete
MFPKLTESKQFKKDLQSFKSALNACPEQYKGRMQELYEVWITKAEQIDIGHDLSSGASVDPRSLKDARFTINHTRTQIFDLMKKLSLNL